jgi:4-hydroxy-3-polyprenylbenzoate decarboxylase
VTGPRRIVLAVTGASGAVIGLRIAERLAACTGVETELVVSPSGRRTLSHEVGADGFDRLRRLVTRAHDPDEVGAAIASGSYRTAGMIVAPCSMHTLSAIVGGLSDNLVTRAADVHLKERRRLVLLARETPLHLGHLRQMVGATEMGAIIMPPVPAFYRLPQSVAELVDYLAARAIDLLDLPDLHLAPEWRG